MAVIDCDAHVLEGVQTWSHLEPEFYPYRPIPVEFPEDTCFGSFNAAWVIDYKLRFFAPIPSFTKKGRRRAEPLAVQEFTDVAGRVEYLDRLGVDKQVLFPSIWLGVLAENVDLEAALARSYNTFMAGQCAQSGGRLFYTAVVPFRRPDLAVQEIRRAKEMGSVAGVFSLGIEGEWPLSHPSFRPIFAEAERQDLPIGIHVGNGASSTISRMLEGVPRPFLNDSPQIHPLGTGLISLPYVLYAFEQVLGSGIMEEFPHLRVGFLEAGAEWTTRLVKGLRRRTGGKVDDWLGERVFVACRLDDDIPYLIDKLGEDFIVTGTDFPHEDAFRQDQIVDGLAERGDLADRTIDKILVDNPQRLWQI